MIEFTFNYQEKEIKYTVDLLGREKVLVDDQVIATPTSRFSSVTEVEFEINDEPLKLTRSVRSYANGEYQITLSNGKKVIDKQAKYVIDLSMSGEETIYRGEEVDWLSEVKLPQGVIYCAFALYFGIIIHTFIGGFTEDALALDISAWGIVLFALASIGVFLYWSVKTIASSPDESELV